MSAPKIALMGLPRSGKDHIGNISGLNRYALGAPLYWVMELFFPGVPKKTPGYIQCLKNIGQWGRAHYDSDYPVSVERGLLCQNLREQMLALDSEKRNYVDWRSYGVNPNIWTEAVLKKMRVDSRDSKHRYGDDLGDLYDNYGAIITDLRAIEDVKFLREKGFEIYLVLTSEETRKKRITAVGELEVWKSSLERQVRWAHVHVGIVEHLNTYYSNYFRHPEIFDQDLNQELEDQFSGKIIWNDAELYPGRVPCISPEDFIQSIKDRAQV